MNASKAVRRMWGLAVMWDAGFEPQEALPAPATVVHVVHHVHHFVPAPAVGGIGPNPRVVQSFALDAITEEITEGEQE